MLTLKSRKRRLRGNSMPLSLIIFLEVTAIIAGVLIGFWLNEWRENRDNRQTANIALESVAAEFRYNHQRMEENYNYYTFIINQIDSLHRAGEPVREMYGYHLDGWRGAMPPMLRSSSYQMILSTGIFKDIPFKEANTLAFIYNLQSILEKMDDASIVNFSHDSGFTSLQNIRHMFNLYAEIIPSVIGVYQHLGLEIMEPYGYNTTLPEGPLKSESDRQMAGFELDF